MKNWKNTVYPLFNIYRFCVEILFLLSQYYDKKEANESRRFLCQKIKNKFINK